MLKKIAIVGSVLGVSASVAVVIISFVALTRVQLGTLIVPRLSALTFATAFTALRSTAITERKWWLFAAVCIFGLLWLGGAIAALSRGGRNSAIIFLVFLVLPSSIVASGLAQRPVAVVGGR